MFFSSLCPSFKDLTRSLPSAPLDLCFSLCSQPSETDGACTVTVTNQFKGYKILTFTFHILSSLFPCVWHPFCSTESSWQPSHKQYKCISKPLETSRSLFSGNVVERHKTCAVYWDYFRSSVLFLMACVVSESEKRSRFSSNLSPEFTEINLWCHK